MKTEMAQPRPIRACIGCNSTQRLEGQAGSRGFALQQGAKSCRASLATPLRVNGRTYACFPPVPAKMLCSEQVLEACGWGRVGLSIWRCAAAFGKSTSHRAAASSVGCAWPWAVSGWLLAGGCLAAGGDSGSNQYGLAFVLQFPGGGKQLLPAERSALPYPRDLYGGSE